MNMWTTKRLVLAGFVAAVFMLALLAGIAAYSTMKSLQMSVWENHSQQILLNAEKINSSMALATAAHRGHMINGSTELLLQRDAALEALHTALDNLTQLAGDDLEQQVRVQHIGRIIPKRLETFALYSALGQSDGIAALTYKLAGGDQTSRRLQEILSQVIQHENRLLKNYSAEERMRVHWAYTSGALLLIFLCGFLIALYLLISRNIRRDESRLALEKSEALLRQILELLPVGVCVTDRDVKIKLINPATHAIWGTHPDAPQTTAYQVWRSDTKQKVEADEFSIARALRHGEVTLNQEFEIQRADGLRKFLRVSAMPLRDADQQIIGAIAVNLDVTDLKQVEQALQAAHDALEARVAMRTRELVVANEQLKSQIEERRRAEDALRSTQNVLTIAQRVAHVGSWEINVATGQAHWSDEFFRICGIEPGSMTPSIAAGLALMHAEDRERISSTIEQALAKGGEYREHARLVRPNGNIRHVLLQGEVVHSDGKSTARLIGSMLDITEQHQGEEMLRQLAAHLQTVREEERKRIAREIHDEMGQNLLALRIDVSMLHARTAHSHPKLHQKVAAVLANIDHTIKSVRTVINNLRPAVLDLGLYASIQWQLQEFQRRSGIICELNATANDIDCGLTEEQTTALFRILQESLTNVARHANARHVQIALHREPERISLRIADDGVGIYPEERRKSKSFGLLGMRERISAIGGELTVESAIGQGTVLSVSIPLEAALEEDLRQGELPLLLRA